MSSADFQWSPEPQAAAWIVDRIDRLRAKSIIVAEFEQRLLSEAGGRLIDWADHLCVQDDTGLNEAGFSEVSTGWYQHLAAELPLVHVCDDERLMVSVDSISDFAIANAIHFDCVLCGSAGDRRRIAIASGSPAPGIGAIERLGCTAYEKCCSPAATEMQRISQAREQFRHRCRNFDTPLAAFTETTQLALDVIEAVGRDVACDLFFAAERDYWQSRNRAARLQYMRQNAMGLGWANHDHHTYRSSRSTFHSLMQFFELLGFRCRERFYAGAEAGWGAQVLEQPVCGITIFADVDLNPDEITEDFAHTPLNDQDSLGTIGLWCALHGEAIFQAGMHHLECQFDYNQTRTQLADCGTSSMRPFTDFPFLRQCFTEGERWTVAADRVAAARQRGWISESQAATFLNDGAIGSHLEILERNDGYRGFNQTGINQIIRQTDPRLTTRAERP